VDKPKTIDPNSWAEFNQAIARSIADVPQPIFMTNKGDWEPLELTVEPYEIRVEVNGPLNELVLAINRAVSDLEGQGERSDRVARQLLTALALFARDTDML
jgi:hypothetical protein